jgi:hypothetical protein
MFGSKYFVPWVGSRYGKDALRLLVLGESRYDEEYTDKQIVRDHLSEGGKTFTNFVQAATGLRRWEEAYDPRAFWERTIFYNYNVTFFPGKPRAALSWSRRACQENTKMLRKVLEKYKPTHAIVWGKKNWDSIKVDGANWTSEKPIPGAREHPYCMVDGHSTLFARVKHPSGGFAFYEWAPMISAFLRLPRRRNDP